MSAKPSDLLEAAEHAVQQSEGWANLSNFLFNPDNGLITKAYPTRQERAEFMQTSEYRAIRELLKSRMDATGLAAGSVPEKSGRFVVRLPKSLHAALEREAKAEGVSLNQLAVTKLAMPLSQAIPPNPEMT